MAPRYAGPHEFQYHLPPFAHQRRIFEQSATRRGFAFFMDQGTGKSKLILDTAAYLYEQGEINAGIIITDADLVDAWAEEQFQEHWPERLLTWQHSWDSGKASTKKDTAARETLLKTRLMAWLFMNIEAVITPLGNRFLRSFLKQRRCLLAIDESSSIGSPSARQTKVMLLLRDMAAYRRIANGTPAAEGPLKVWSQGKFCGDEYMSDSYTAHKALYAQWFTHNVADRRGVLRPIQMLARDEEGRPKYQNLKHLQQEIEAFSVRVRKEDCLDLPPKLPAQQVYFDLSPEQSRLYHKLREESLLELGNLGRVSAREVMVRRIRLEQIACGYLPLDPEAVDPFKDDPLEDRQMIQFHPNPRLAELMKVLERLPADKQVIIWCRFRPDVDAIMELLGSRAVRYDGLVSRGERVENRRAFQAGHVPYYVGNVAVGVKGQNLQTASYSIFYSHHDSLEKRIQAEDRSHRYGMQPGGCTYIDIVARGTIDIQKAQARRDKIDVMQAIHGERWAEWLG